MVLQAVILPSRPAIEAAAAVVRTVSANRDDGAGGQQRRSRFGGRRAAAPAERVPFALHDPALARLPITSFGKVTTGDAGRLTTAVADAVAGLAPPRVRLAGGLVLEPLGDDQVWVRVSGADDLGALPRAVVSAVERVGFFCDRRAFRAELPLARVTDETTEADLEAVLAALEAFVGEPWPVDHVALVERSPRPGVLPDREVALVPIGPADGT